MESMMYMYTFDEEFDIKKIDDPMQSPPHFSARLEGSPVWDDFPRVIYHTCDRAAFLSIIWQRAHYWRLSTAVYCLDSQARRVLS